jgi:hypothetical protein
MVQPRMQRRRRWRIARSYRGQPSFLQSADNSGVGAHLLGSWDGKGWPKMHTQHSFMKAAGPPRPPDRPPVDTRETK